MSLPVSHLYEFGNFRLDTKEKILICGDQPVALTPKGFELLSVMVENHGRLLKKDELMDRIWADSFVEESNLTFNIRQLRKILGDDAQSPKYIKTVRQHGYRFIADVKQISTEEKRKAEAEVSTVEEIPKVELIAPVKSVAPNDFQPAEVSPVKQTSAAPKTRSFLVPVFVASIILLVGAAVIGSWYVRSKNFAPNAPVLSASFASEKLSTNGKVVHAALSPDGKKVVYTNGKDSDKESVWLRQLEDGNNIEIIPPSSDIYSGLAFSPDGNVLYFARRGRQINELTGIYRVSIFGGIPNKIISETEGWMSISPDGGRISFVRCPHRDDENCSLWIADSADGKNELKLVSRPRPFRIGDNNFSPDGKSVAFAVGQSENAANEFSLAEVNLESGKERELTGEKFFNIRNLAWLPDQSGWLITASRIPNRSSRIWQVSAANGEVVPMTKDSESYSHLNLDKEATKIVTTQFKDNFHLRLLPIDNPSAIQNLTDASSASFAPNGKIYFSSAMSGNDEIWSINADGSSQRQLTNNAADESLPIVSRDNNSVFFVSNRTGAAQVWRMNPDGSNQTPVTQQEGGFPMFASPDGEWLYYVHGIKRTLWRVSLKSGDEQLVFDKAKSTFSFAPDGSQIAFSERQGDERVLNVVSLADLQTIKTFHLADRKNFLLNIVWMPDGKNLAYISANREFENHILWLQPLDEDAPHQLAALGDEELRGFGFAVSSDGKTFVLAQGEWLHDAVLLKGLR